MAVTVESASLPVRRATYGHKLRPQPCFVGASTREQNFWDVAERHATSEHKLPNSGSHIYSTTQTSAPVVSHQPHKTLIGCTKT
jgi:hypothetical protein